MITFLKNKKCRIVVIFILLLLAFFCFFKINFLEVFAPAHLESNHYKLEEELLDNKNSSQNYAELEISDGRDEAVPRLYDDNSENNNVTNPVNANNETRKDLPKLLEIPRIKINASVQSVGLNSKNEMDVPSNDWDVAWYNLGTKPGKIGSAVIAGHLDNRFGKPAVFWNLGELEIGDDIFVVDGNNNKKRFQVISSEKYETGTAPLEKIFGANDGIYLNLITCGGVWDRTKDNYSERFVVFAEYVSK